MGIARVAGITASLAVGLALAFGSLPGAGSAQARDGGQARGSGLAGWKKCGEFYLVTPKQPVLFLTRRIGCIEALEVVAHAIVEPGIATCLSSGCEAVGFACRRPSAPAGTLIHCVRGSQQLQVRASKARSPDGK